MPTKQRVLDATLQAYLAYLKEDGKAPVTINGYRWIIQTATDALVQAGMEANPKMWTRDEVNYIRNVVFSTQQNGVKRRHIAVLNTYLLWCGNSVIRSMHIQWPADEKGIPDHLELQESTRLLAAAQGLERWVIQLELNEGLRRVEVLRLRAQDMMPGFIHVCGKGRGGGKWRMVPYHPDTPREYKALLALREQEIAQARAKNPAVVVPDNLLIYERGGNLFPYQKTAVDNMVKAVSSRVNITFSNHTLRRTYGRTLWLMNKMRPGSCPIETIAKLMGHESTKMTMEYLGIYLDDMTEAMNLLGQFQNALPGAQNLPARIVSGQSGIHILRYPDGCLSILVTHARRKENPFLFLFIS